MSVPGLIVLHDGSFKLFEFIDELELEHHDLHYNLVTEISKPTIRGKSLALNTFIQGCVNGLLLLISIYPTTLYVCNPITREYIELPRLKQDEGSVTYGFGVSVTSHLHKVIGILQERELDENMGFQMKHECWVYTLERGEWKKSVMPCPTYNYSKNGHGNSRNNFFNGNIHWLAIDLNDDFFISCFDLETEVFSTFSTPTLGRPSIPREIVVFENCLSICENAESDNAIVIWVMKEYRNEKSWTKQFVLTIASRSYGQYFFPMKVFKDGDILLHWLFRLFLYYSKKTNSIQKLDLFELQQGSFLQAWLHVPSFLSLGSLTQETVRKLKLSGNQFQTKNVIAS